MPTGPPVTSAPLNPVPPEGRISRPVAGLLLLVVTSAAGAAAYAAGWPREQIIMACILAGTVLLWVAETLPLFATAFVSVVMQLLLLGNPGGWLALGERGDAEDLHAFLSAAADPVLLLFFSGWCCRGRR